MVKNKLVRYGSNEDTDPLVNHDGNFLSVTRWPDFCSDSLQTITNRKNKIRIINLTRAEYVQ